VEAKKIAQLKEEKEKKKHCWIWLRKERNKRQETGLETPDKAQKTLKYKDFKIHRVDIAPQVKVSGSNPPLENYKLGGKKKSMAH